MPSDDEINFAFDEPAPRARREAPRYVEPEPEPDYSLAVRSAPNKGAPSLGRVLPHSLEAEEYLLSCCLLDGPDVISRCLEARISGDSFYDTKHGIVYERLLELYNRQAPIDVSVVAEELKTARQLDAVGGYAFLTQVSSRIPTTAQADYFIEKVRELAVLRRLIRSATGAVEDCYNYSGGLADFAAEIEAKLTSITREARGELTWQPRPLTDFALPPANDPSILLGKYRYLCRGGALVLVGSSGTGKSSASLQMAVMWALGRDFLGITCRAPLRSIIVQAEDDEGDVAEVWISIAAAFKLTAAEIALVKTRVLIVEDRINTGPAFITELKTAVTRWKPDLVFLNPLLSFAGCNISEQEQMTAFLRGGLNRANAEKRFAYIVVHHTNKPPNEKAQRNWNEYMYNMSGSVELPNWARAVITIEAKKTEGQFLVRLAKRGKRAGVTKETPTLVDGEESGVFRTEIVTKIHAQHSTQKIQLQDGRSLQMMVWEAGSESAPEADTGKPRGADSEQQPRKPGPAGKYSFDDYMELWPVGEENAMPNTQLQHRISAKTKIPDGSWNRLLKDAVAAGKLAFKLGELGKKTGYYRPL